MNWLWLEKLLGLNAESLQKVITGALIAGGGALLTYIAQNLSSIDFGIFTPAIVASLSILINYVRKLLEELQKPPVVPVPVPPPDDLKVV